MLFGLLVFAVVRFASSVARDLAASHRIDQSSNALHWEWLGTKSKDDVIQGLGEPVRRGSAPLPTFQEQAGGTPATKKNFIEYDGSFGDWRVVQSYFFDTSDKDKLIAMTNDIEGTRADKRINERRFFQDRLAYLNDKFSKIGIAGKASSKTCTWDLGGARRILSYRPDN